MMKVIKIKKGRDIPLKGAAEQELTVLPLPEKVAIQPPDFTGTRLRLLVKLQENVLAGTPVLEDKADPRIRITSPVSGRVAEIIRGEKRVLLAVVIECGLKQESIPFPVLIADQVRGLSAEAIVQALLQSGLWPCLRQRPFARIASPDGRPKSIFVQAHNTDPLAPSIDFILQGREKSFQTGLEILKKLSAGNVYLCCPPEVSSEALRGTSGVQKFGFAGPHPAGNVSTAIHYLDPVKKGEKVWYINAEDVVRFAELFLRGRYSAVRTVAVTGEGANRRQYYQTVQGALVRSLLPGGVAADQRVISGSVLRGADVGADGFLCFYDQQITVIPQGGARKLLGWIRPGWNAYSFSRTFSSSLKRQSRVSLDTDLHGSLRAIVLNHVYDRYVALDIMTFFLLRAVISGDLEEAERMGILECVPEDFALCAFACPSKIDVGDIIRQGLEMIEKEG